MEHAFLLLNGLTLEIKIIATQTLEQVQVPLHATIRSSCCQVQVRIAAGDAARSKSELLEEMKGRQPVLGDMGFPNNNNDFEPEYLPNLQ